MEQRDDLDGAREAYTYAVGQLSYASRLAVEAVLGLGRVAERMGDLSEARRWYLRAADAGQDDPKVAAGAWLGLAGIAERMGDLSEARRWYLRAADAGQDDPKVAAGAWLGLAGIAERMGDLSEARRWYLRAAENAGVHGDSGLLREATRKRLGDEAANIYVQSHGSQVNIFNPSSRTDSEVRRLHDEVRNLHEEVARLSGELERQRKLPRKSSLFPWLKSADNAPRVVFEKLDFLFQGEGRLVLQP
jgi:tetratricopeptide (TPR) repeat protein